MMKSEDYYFENLYAVSNKEDMAYLCLHFTRNHAELKMYTLYPKDPIRRYVNFKDSIKEVVTETMTKLTSQEYMEEVQAYYVSNSTTPRFDDNAKFELGVEFLKILQDNAFNRINGDDVVDHTAKFLAILELIKIPNIDPNQLRLHVFPLSLTGDARKWSIDEICYTAYSSYDTAYPGFGIRRYGVSMPALHKKPRRPIRRIQKLLYILQRIENKAKKGNFQSWRRRLIIDWQLRGGSRRWRLMIRRGGWSIRGRHVVKAAVSGLDLMHLEDCSNEWLLMAGDGSDVIDWLRII
ncbi:hypothetical protein Tco_1010024 [Tanacetum coccineum]